MAGREFEETLPVLPIIDAAVAAEKHHAVVLADVCGVAQAVAPPWLYNRVLRVTQRHVQDIGLPDSALHAFAVARMPTPWVLKDWLRACIDGDLSWLPWSAIVFEAEGVDGQPLRYAVADPDDQSGGRFDLEIADLRLPPITDEQVANYVQVLAQFMGKIYLMEDHIKNPVVKAYEAHWGYDAAKTSVQAVHAGETDISTVVQIRNVKERLLQEWKCKVLLELMLEIDL